MARAEKRKGQKKSNVSSSEHVVNDPVPPESTVTEQTYPVVPREGFVEAALLGLATFLVYAYTSYPSVAGRSCEDMH